MWLSLIRIASSSPKRWLKPPPQRTAYFCKRAQARRGLARAADARACVCAISVTNAAVARRDAREVTEEIQRHALGRQHGARVALDREQRGPGRDRVAVALVRRDRDRRVELAQRRLDQRQPGDGAGLARDHDSARARVPSGTVAIEVTSPARPRSSASARVTAASISSGERNASGQSEGGHAARLDGQCRARGCGDRARA